MSFDGACSRARSAIVINRSSPFVDTSAFVALRNSAEAEHEAARAALSGLLDEGAALFTSNYALDTHFAQRGLHVHPSR